MSVSKNISKFMTILAIFSVSSAFAADGPTELSASEVTFKVDGERATALRHALQGAGAVQHPGVGVIRYTVLSIKCTSGYLIGGRGQAKSCQIQQKVPSFNTIRTVKRLSKGTKARALINALEDAGVKGQQRTEITTYATRAVNCSQAIRPGNHSSSCSITIAN